MRESGGVGSGVRREGPWARAALAFHMYGKPPAGPEGGGGGGGGEREEPFVEVGSGPCLTGA